MPATQVERFKVGDTVWVPYAGPVKVTRPCRVCAGTKRVTIILGSGEQVGLDCGMCSHGYESPRGIEEDYEFGATASSYPVTGIEVVVDEDGEHVRYRSGSGGCYSILDHEKCYATRDEALANGAEQVAAAAVESEERLAYKEKDTNKSYAWNAGYHLREAKRCREQADRHEKKAVLLKAKAKSDAR